MASLEAAGVGPRADICSVAGRRKLELDLSGMVRETNDVDGGRRGVGGDLAKQPVMVAGRVPEVGAYGKDGVAETVSPIMVRDKVVAWIQKSGARIS